MTQRSYRHVNLDNLDLYPVVFQVGETPLDEIDDLRELDTPLDERGVYGLWSDAAESIVGLVFNDTRFDEEGARAWIEEHAAEDAGDVPVTALNALERLFSGLMDVIALGGPGSGNWGHAGRPGQVGGSLPRSAGMSIASGKDWKKRQAKARARATSQESAPTQDDINRFRFVSEKSDERARERYQRAKERVDTLNKNPNYNRVSAGNNVTYWTAFGEKSGKVKDVKYIVGDYEHPVRVQIEIEDPSGKTITLGPHADFAMAHYNLKQVSEEEVALGGPGSGNWGHAGRPGQRGGSLPRGAAMSIKSGQDWKQRYKKTTGRAYSERPSADDAGGNVARGRTTKAFSNDTNTQYEFDIAVVPLDSLIPSNTDKGGINPDYDQALQPRERSRAASQAQISQMASNLTPEALVWDFHQLDKGAPIVGEDMMVESGNGRTLALRRAMQQNPERWAAYQETLRGNLDAHGIDPDDVAGIENPVLVRIRKSDVDRSQFAQEANSPAVLQMSPVEKAAQDARNLSETALTSFDMKEGWNIDTALRRASNRPFVRKFMETLPRNEQANMQRSDGTLNRMGLWRVKAAMFMKVFPGDSGHRLADTFFESLDSSIKNFENAVSDIMPQLARAEHLISSGQRDRRLSLAEDISKAVDMLARLKEQGIAPRDYVRQTSMFGRELSGTQERLLVAFDGMSRSRKSIRQVMSTYADQVINAPDPAQGTMFGNVGLTRDQLVDRVLEAANAN